MAETGSSKSLLRKMLPRIVKATVKGAIYFVFFYVLPTLWLSFLSSRLPGGAPNIFASYGQLVEVFSFVIVFFVVATELTSGTIFQHAFNIGKALIIMILIVYALDGGIITLDVMNIHVAVDLTFYLVMLLTIDLVGLGKSVLQAINFLSEKAETEKISTET